MVDIKVTRETLDALVKAHKEAHDAGLERFMFQGNEFYTKYAHYLIHYLQGVLK